MHQDGLDFSLYISDEGAGIAAEDIGSIFERFYTRRGGVGVGLSVAKRIAEGHGGTIRVASEPGQGSTFTVTLPSLASQLETGDSLE